MDEPSSRIRLYIDEDVHESVAPANRQHVIAVLTVRRGRPAGAHRRRAVGLCCRTGAYAL